MLIPSVTGTVDFLRKLELDNDSLTKSIIGTIGDVDSYQLPDSKGRTAFMRHILGISDAERQARREQILGTTVKDFRSGVGGRILYMCACTLVSAHAPASMLLLHVCTAFCWALLGHLQCRMRLAVPNVWNSCLSACREFADVLEAVRGDSAQVVAVTSSSRAEEANKDRPGFFDKITKVL